MNAARAPPGSRYPLPAIHPHRFWDDPLVSDPASTRPRDPAWVWYALAVAALVLVVVLDATGVLNRLGP